MGSQGPLGGGTFTSDPTLGVVAITNPSNAGAPDGTFATALLLLGQANNYLVASNFGFQVPPDAIVTGIVVEILQQSTVNLALLDYSIKLLKGGVIGGANKALGITLPLVAAYQTYGDANDLWGQNLTPADVNSPNFGIACSAVASVLATVQIDYIRATVYWIGSNRFGSDIRHISVGDGMSRNEEAS